MKTFLFLLTAISVCASCSAQRKGNIRLYGFEQAVAGGKAPDRNDKGLRVSKGGGKNYFLYAVSSSRIYPTEIWVEGTRFGATIKTIEQTPVEYGDETNIGSPKKVLIPKTSQKVVQLIPNASTESKESYARAKNLAQKNELVVVYKQNGRFYYQTLARLTSLNSAAMQ
ncbi:MAG TPA: hypothetical protein VFT06_02480 [Flavisolibacter sp.]|nr:hypothetical protein [Flavisolibacter sp.]